MEEKKLPPITSCKGKSGLVYALVVLTVVVSFVTLVILVFDEPKLIGASSSPRNITTSNSSSTSKTANYIWIAVCSGIGLCVLILCINGFCKLYKMRRVEQREIPLQDMKTQA
jgi:hypothetical protein